MKALEKDRSRRYETATQFADDLKNHLTNLPVVARPRSSIYLIKKSLQRNRALATGVVGVFLSMIVISGILFWKNNQLSNSLRETKRAESEYSAINTFLIDNLLGQANPELNPYQDKTTVVQLLDRASAELNNADLFVEQTEVEASIHLAIGKTYFALGDLSLIHI